MKNACACLLPEAKAKSQNLLSEIFSAEKFFHNLNRFSIPSIHCLSQMA